MGPEPSVWNLRSPGANGPRAGSGGTGLAGCAGEGLAKAGLGSKLVVGPDRGSMKNASKHKSLLNMANQMHKPMPAGTAKASLNGAVHFVSGAGVRGQKRIGQKVAQETAF